VLAVEGRYSWSTDKQAPRNLKEIQMSKKDKKKFDAEGQVPATTPEYASAEGQAQVTEAQAAAEAAVPKAPAIPKAPSLYLEAAGVQYKFTRFPLPKKANKAPEGELTIYVDNTPLPAWTTASKGWAAEDATIEYIWATLPSGDTGYLTCDYGQPALEFSDVNFTLGEGKANRDDPKRVPRDAEKDKARIALFQAAMAAKKITPAEAAVEVAAEPQEAA